MENVPGIYDWSLLDTMLRTPSPSGFEDDGQRVWVEAVRPLADRVETDSYGTAWATIEGTGGPQVPRLMVEAHGDEIGYMVSHISESGFLYLNRVGGSDVAIARGRRVCVLGDRGVVDGVIGNTAIHLRDRKDGEKAPEIHQLFVDIGACDRKEVAEAGVRVGHPLVLAGEPFDLRGGRLVGRALDNRVGGFILVELVRRLAGTRRPAATVLAVNAVQEELGLKGAEMIAYRLKPTLAIVLDVTHATDTPGIDAEKHGRVTLGGGPTLTHGTANHRRLVALLSEAAEAAGIAIQHEASSRSTGTDTDAVYVTAGGIPSALVSIPLRYMHSPVETVDRKDIEAAVALLAEFIWRLEPGSWESP